MNFWIWRKLLTKWQPVFVYENNSQVKIKHEKLRVETIVRNVTDAIIGFDENGIVTFVNPVAVKLLSIDEKDIIGSSAQQAAADNDLLFKLINEFEHFRSIIRLHLMSYIDLLSFLINPNKLPTVKTNQLKLGDLEFGFKT